MNPHDDNFKAELAADLQRLYERGLPETIEAEAVPASTELGEWVSNETNTGESGYSRLQNEILLREAIHRIRGNADRKQGLEKLFGISGDEVLGLQARRENAANLLGYKDADTLRRGEVDKRPLRDVILEELLDQMLALASERGFSYVARYCKAEPLGDDTTEPGNVPGLPETPAAGVAGSRRILLLVGVAILVAAGAIVVAITTSSNNLNPKSHFDAWGPNRPIYDYNQFNGNHNCADPSNPARYYGRCGAQVAYPVFNSFINTPSYGDERAFFDGYKSDRPKGKAGDPVTDVTEGSKIVVLRVYVDNMAQVYPEDPDKTTAHNTRVRIALPGDTGDEQLAYAYIGAEHATTVYNSVRLTASQPFQLEYISGSAILLRDNHSYPLSDEIIGSQGALIGVNVMNGVFPPSSDFSTATLVELKVRAVPQATTS
jgi:hypothetical protein